MAEINFSIPLRKDISFQVDAQEAERQNSILQKLLNALYPNQCIHWVLKPALEEIDLYVIVGVCPYGAEEAPLLQAFLSRALEILDREQVKAEANIVILFYRDLKVNFPERKLQREKAMSAIISQELLKRQAMEIQGRVHIAHEFGPYHVSDTLQQFKGRHLYFELLTATSASQ